MRGAGCILLQLLGLPLFLSRSDSKPGASRSLAVPASSLKIPAGNKKRMANFGGGITARKQGAGVLFRILFCFCNRGFFLGFDERGSFLQGGGLRSMPMLQLRNVLPLCNKRLFFYRACISCYYLLFISLSAAARCMMLPGFKGCPCLRFGCRVLPKRRR